MSSSPQPSRAAAILLTQGRGAERRRIELNGVAFRIGRASAAELSFPENAELSREHFLIEHTVNGWVIQDLNSRNGTTVNGSRIHGRVSLADQDVIVAGHLLFTFQAGAPVAPHRIVLSADPLSAGPGHTRITDLQSALASESSGNLLSTERAHLRAFLRAGRELVSQRTVDELFQIILETAVDAAGAARGVVALQDANGLNIRAQQGSGFHLSTGIVNQVLVEKKSLLIVDIAGQSDLANRESIVAGRVKSFIAVPLQTDEHTIGLLYVDTPCRVVTFTPEDLNLLTVLANVAAIRIEHTRLLEIEQQEKLWARDREQAAEIQRSLLPTAAPAIPGFEVAGYNVASRSVGGDYYDFLKLNDGRLGLVVADVAGKGMPAALLMSGLQARVHVLFESSEDMAGHVAKLNRSLAESFPLNRFVTFFIAALSPETGHLIYCNAGHNAPILLRADGHAEQLASTGPVLGISAKFTFSELACRLFPGDLLALYSDGVTEACHPVLQEEFGEERLLQILRDNLDKSPTGIIEAITRRLAVFTADTPLADDVTLVIVRRLTNVERRE